MLKVKVDGSIHLSVPKNTSNNVINNFIKDHENWILDKLKKIQNFPVKSVDKSYKNGDNIEYLGNLYTLNILKDTKNKVFLNGNNIIISTKEYNSEEKIKKILYKWYKENAIQVFNSSLEKYSKLTTLNFNELKIRKMKNKWGSCRYLKKIITLNLELIKKPIECIEYVALHEIAHIKYPHHKKEFWDFINIYMPDWKIRKERLK
nr:SprT family zinc-dependent metalloprotease [uncultured Cetobacterium sp.]